MNSTWKLLPAGLLLAVLAGCGGGGGEMTEPTAEEKCSADGGIYEDGACKSADDLRNEGAQEEGDKRDQEDADEQAAADAVEARMKAAQLLSILMSDGDPDASPAVPDPSMIMTANTGYADADMKDRMVISIMGEKFSEEYETADGTLVTAISADGKATLTLGATTHTRVMGDAFSKGATKTHRHDKVRADGTTTYFSTMGSYHGVMGTYECTGTCSSVIPADGEGLTLAGTWTFTPSNPDALVTDADGLEYGWWATGTPGSVTAAHVFYAGDTLAVITGGLPQSHGGTATYKGGAMGKYAIHGGTAGMNDSGHFTADAELMATFGTGTGAGISGTVDGFMGADGESRDWEVTLKNLTTHTSGVYSGTGNVVWMIGEDSSGDTGGWQVATFGSDATATTGAPAAVAGGFQASHGIANGHIIGAFGADME